MLMDVRMAWRAVHAAQIMMSGISHSVYPDVEAHLQYSWMALIYSRSCGQCVLAVRVGWSVQVVCDGVPDLIGRLSNFGAYLTTHHALYLSLLSAPLIVYLLSTPRGPCISLINPTFGAAAPASSIPI